MSELPHTLWCALAQELELVILHAEFHQAAQLIWWRRSVVCHVAGATKRCCFSLASIAVIRAVMRHKASMDILPYKYGSSVPAYRL